MIMQQQPSMGNGIQEQLELMYAERELLQTEIGVSDPEEVIGMVRNLEEQLRDFYDRFGGRDELDDAGMSAVLNQVQTLSQSLDQHFSAREVVLEVKDGKPILRAFWREELKG